LVSNIKGRTQTEGAREQVLRDDIIRGWRKFQNEELHNVYSSSSIMRMISSKRMRLAGHVVCMGAKGNLYGILVGIPEGIRPLGRPKRM
jgi:hypothetical protein